MAEMGDDRPLAVPNDLRSQLRLHTVTKITGATILINNEQDSLWSLLPNPSLADDNPAREETLAWVERLAAPVKEANKSARIDFQDLFLRDGVPRPPSAAELIRHYTKNEDFVYEVVAPLYEDGWHCHNHVEASSDDQLLTTYPTYPVVRQNPGHVETIDFPPQGSHTRAA